jgi:hypothetical protein
MRIARSLRVAAAAAAVAMGAGLPLTLGTGSAAANASSSALCGAQDTRETGLQGDVPRTDQLSGRADQGYNCGLAVVGHNDLGGRGASDLAWSASCAYVKDVAGNLVTLDVSDPTRPVVTDTENEKGQTENIYARTTAARAIVAIAQSGGGNGAGGTPVDVYDVKTDCAHPRKLGTIRFPQNVHNVEISPDATKVFGSMPIEEADISNLSDPATWTVKMLQCEIGAQLEPLLYPPASPNTTCASPMALSQFAHEFDFNASGSRMYIGDQLAPQEQCLHIVDLTVSPVKVLGSMCNTNGSSAGHAVRRMSIGKHPYLLNSNETATVDAFSHLAINAAEAKGVPAGAEMTNPGGIPASACIPQQATPHAGAAQAWITDIGDETHPQTVSELELAINDPANCAARVQSGVNPTVHYEGIDNPDDTTFVMLPMKNAGLRIWDVHDPKGPTEVAYFNPAQYTASDGTKVLDRARMHTYYDRHTGYIWLTTETGGLWVLELEPRVRHALGLPIGRALYPDGEPAKPGVQARAVLPPSAAAFACHPYSC